MSVLSDRRQERVSRAIQQLNGSYVRTKVGALQQGFDGPLIACQSVGLSKGIRPKDMPYTVRTLHWAADYVVQTEARLAIVHKIAECLRKRSVAGIRENWKVHK